ncbi:hypothetical protein IM40_01415 [Candidatus Paracaedimonas acanthamoebae]|nr:hypothetical protein IM40_01415 [Candidatus Paracaedimonas acanthamoebae]
MNYELGSLLMKAMLLLLFLTLQLMGCTPSQQCLCPEDCFRTPQTPITSLVLYEAFSGSVIACHLSTEDRLIAAYNAQSALKDGQLKLLYTWESPSSSLNGSFELLSFHEEKNTICFKYKQSIDIYGKIIAAQGLACQTPYQVWRIVNEIPNTNPWFNSNPTNGFKASSELKARLSRFVD